MKISAVYKITNTVTNDFYIGSSKDVKQRWASHKWPSKWKRYSNNPMYIDMQRYGVDKFEFEILEEVEEGKLKEKEQQFIETLKPTYNSNRANGWDFERYKEYNKEYYKSNKGKESHRKANNKYYNHYNNLNQQIAKSEIDKSEKKESITNSETISNTNNSKRSSISDQAIFEIMGIKLYLDDLIILGVLYFLYEQNVKDEMLYIILFLLLIS